MDKNLHAPCDNRPGRYRLLGPTYEILKAAVARTSEAIADAHEAREAFHDADERDEDSEALEQLRRDADCKVDEARRADACLADIDRRCAGSWRRHVEHHGRTAPRVPSRCRARSRRTRVARAIATTSSTADPDSSSDEPPGDLAPRSRWS